MVWQVDWDGDFVIGGSDQRRLTPNFRLSEFRSAGAVRVHRELVSAVQMLRNRFASSVSVVGTDSDGLGATLRGNPVSALVTAAERVRDHHLFVTVEEVSGDLHVRIPEPAAASRIAVAQALETAFCVTARFETQGDPFEEVTGNFDGAGVSFGPGQVNFGTGTLVPVFRAFEAADEASLRACFTDPDDYEEWMDLLARPKDEQIAWATAHTTGRFNNQIVEPWCGYLQAVGRVPAFRRIMVGSLLREYGRRVQREVAYLAEVTPDIVIDHLRCFCALYDLVIQQGSLSKAKSAIEKRVELERPRDQFHLVRIAVEERSRTASTRWRNDCESRRVGILNGVPTTVGQSQRANINFYLLRDVRVDVQGTSPVEALETVVESLSSGETLLA